MANEEGEVAAIRRALKSNPAANEGAAARRVLKSKREAENPEDQEVNIEK